MVRMVKEGEDGESEGKGEGEGKDVGTSSKMPHICMCNEKEMGWCPYGYPILSYFIILNPILSYINFCHVY